MLTRTHRSNYCLKVAELFQKQGVLYGFYYNSVVFMVFYVRTVCVKIVCKVETERNFLTFTVDSWISMRRLIFILSLMVFLLTLSHNVSATRQALDVVIIDKVDHKLNVNLLSKLDSDTYNALKKELDFGASSYSGNWRGHISTFEVRGNKLFLNSIETSKVHTDFKGLLDKYMDKKGRVFASWVSGTFICGAGDCLYVARNGFENVYEQETELIIENGTIISSRTYSNKTYGTLYLDAASRMISQGLDLSKIKTPNGRITVKIDALKFSDEGKVTEWSVEFRSGHENLSVEIKEMIVKEVNRVFSLIDWKTYCRDGEWHWLPQNGITYPLIFQ